MQMLLPMALMAALASSPTQEPVRAVERVLPDGSRERYEVLRDAPEGTEVRHGTYERFHPGGELAARGSFDHGLASDRWRLVWANGEKQAAGNCRDGRVQGTWRVWYPDSDLGSKGRLAEIVFDEGRRSGEQEVWLPDGRLDPRRSGPVVHLEQDWPGGAPRLRGTLVGGHLDGQLRLDWPDGTPALRGYFAGSRPVGPWRAVHPDGFEDPLVLARSAPADWIPSLADVFEGRLPGLEPSLAASDGEPGAAAEGAGADPDARLDGALAALVQWLTPAPEDPEGAAVAALREREPYERVVAALAEIGERRGTAVEAAVQERLTVDLQAGFGTVLGLGLVEASSAAEHRRALSRLALLTLLCADDDFAWAAEARQRATSPAIEAHGASSPTDAASPAQPVFDAALVHLGEAALIRRLEPVRGRTASELDEPVARAIAAGLDWLARHRSTEGSWSGAAFSAGCAGSGTICDGAGFDYHDLGLTALALLAFADAGVDARDPEHGATVRAGLAWLVGEWDQNEQMFGPIRATNFLYDQALACQVLARYHDDLHSELLQELVRGSVAFLGRARNPYGAWHYDLPPTGENNTSTTYWCIEALAAADRILPEGVDADCFEGALSWVYEVSDRGNGRCGYNTVGSSSSRLEGMHERFPADHGEAMTSAALAIHLHSANGLGDPIAPKSERAQLVEKGLDLILRRRPEWSDDGESVDLYYWRLGARAIHQFSSMSPGGSAAWLAALEHLLLGHQDSGHCSDGSWDPIGPWGFVAGRVYSTSMAVSALAARVDGVGATRGFDVEAFGRRR
ncbi:hypothetical protein [Engelhardtia mirabilis]|uniref:MORN repeat variant n=1 Tax=Engelhardtia mirabilis TaxID=2528011 RepID=A0A518BNM8_9BACT|nr:hypothetical protein Pla133_36840 [Planctomycetes bacterium Pla133]QDV02910.1 hypothetical protein Pla86_36820 [Planctomycetes bacterium Pla86]